MVVFLGVIFAFALGNANVEGIIQCRKECDILAGHKDPPKAFDRRIKYWSPGPDKRILTNDDTLEGSSSIDHSFFIEQLEHPLNLTDICPKNKFLNSSEEIFFAMANLTKSTKTTDSYEGGILEDLQGAFRKLIYDSDMHIENSAYMPIFYSEE
jgi:hypothetical protein